MTYKAVDVTASVEVTLMGTRHWRRAWQLLALAVLIPALTVAAWQQSSHTHSPAGMATSEWDGFIGTMNAMHLAMSSVEPSGDTDTDFGKLMLPHHRAAIDMAKIELQYGKDPQMRRLAQEIIADQKSEIDLMQLWLKKAHAN
jgi:uncharacterized protein (DUF305 family)